MKGKERMSRMLKYLLVQRTSCLTAAIRQLINQQAVQPTCSHLFAETGYMQQLEFNHQLMRDRWESASDLLLVSFSPPKLTEWSAENRGNLFLFSAAQVDSWGGLLGWRSNLFLPPPHKFTPELNCLSCREQALSAPLLSSPT